MSTYKLIFTKHLHIRLIISPVRYLPWDQFQQDLIWGSLSAVVVNNRSLVLPSPRSYPIPRVSHLWSHWTRLNPLELLCREIPAHDQIEFFVGHNNSVHTNSFELLSVGVRLVQKLKMWFLLSSFTEKRTTYRIQPERNEVDDVIINIAEPHIPKAMIDVVMLPSCY